jgi:hypothetical protein
MKMKIAVVVCAFIEARWADLKEALASFAQQTRLPDAVVLVTDHNPKMYEHAIEALIPRFPFIRVIENKKKAMGRWQKIVGWRQPKPNGSPFWTMMPALSQTGLHVLMRPLNCIKTRCCHVQYCAGVFVDC